MGADSDKRLLNLPTGSGLIRFSIGVIFAAATVYATVALWSTLPEAQRPVSGRVLFVVGGVILLPPLWFLLEFALLAPKEPGAMEDFKYGQELARNFWLAAAVVVAASFGLAKFSV